MLTTRPRGTNDILPGEVENGIFSSAKRGICREYGTRSQDTIFEHTELFLRGVGDTTDIVEKRCTPLSIEVNGVSPCGLKIQRLLSGLI